MRFRFFRRSLACFAFSASMGWSPCAAAEAARVLFVSHEKTPLSERIRAELEAKGFQIVLSDELDPSGNFEVSAAAQVIETPPPRRIELWLMDQSAGRLALDRVLEAEQGAGDPSADATSAVRVSEQLRAFFQPLSESAAAVELMPPLPAPRPLEPRATPPAIAKIPASKPTGLEEGRFFQELSAALPAQPGSVGLDVLFRARLRFGPNAAVANAVWRISTGRP